MAPAASWRRTCRRLIRSSSAPRERRPSLGRLDAQATGGKPSDPPRRLPNCCRTGRRSRDSCQGRPEFRTMPDGRANPSCSTSMGRETRFRRTRPSHAAIGDFDHDYSPGTGEPAAPAAGRAGHYGALAPLTAAQRPLQADLNARSLAGSNPAEATVRLPLALLQQQTEPHQPKLFASVTLNLPQRGTVILTSSSTAPTDRRSSSRGSPCSGIQRHAWTCHFWCRCPLLWTIAQSRVNRRRRQGGTLKFSCLCRETGQLFPEGEGRALVPCCGRGGQRRRSHEDFAQAALIGDSAWPMRWPPRSASLACSCSPDA